MQRNLYAISVFRSIQFYMTILYSSFFFCDTIY